MYSQGRSRTLNGGSRVVEEIRRHNRHDGKKVGKVEALRDGLHVSEAVVGDLKRPRSGVAIDDASWSAFCCVWLPLWGPDMTSIE